MIGLGCLGGAFPDVLRFVKQRYETELPKHWKSLNFWLGFILLLIVGGFASWLGGATDIKTALAFGFGGPEVIARLLSSNQPATLSGGGSFQVIRRWWAF
jgi:hypothetical protein